MVISMQFLNNIVAMLMFYLCVLLFLFGGEALPVNFTVPPAIFGFGDSIIDQGNNNNLITTARANFIPYGRDFPTGKPTGRFCNGKTPADLIAGDFGVKELLPAYLDPNLTDSDFITGVSFASGGSGYDDLTSLSSLVFSMTDQLKMFQEYIQKLKAIVGEERANFTITNAMYFGVAGTDDLVNTYFTLNLRRLQYDVPSYSYFVVAGASKFVQGLYELGARKIVLLSLPPIGCLPFQRTIASFPVRNCQESYNEAATYLNSIFASEMKTLSTTLPQAKILFVDIYTPMLNMIQHPQNYGFEISDRGCCGTGLAETVIFCNQFVPLCPDVSKHIFWDGYHPSELGYRRLLNQVIGEILTFANS